VLYIVSNKPKASFCRCFFIRAGKVRGQSDNLGTAKINYGAISEK
jgi:hypothetical protein